MKDPEASTNGFTYGFDTIEMGTDKGQAEVEKLRQYLLREKTGKENLDSVEAIVSGILVVVLVLGLGLSLLKGRGR